MLTPANNWLGFRISDPIQNPDHLQTNLFLTIQNLDKVGFQILTVYTYYFVTLSVRVWNEINYLEVTTTKMLNS